jgi:hypothetical protein
MQGFAERAQHTYALNIWHNSLSWFCCCCRFSQGLAARAQLVEDIQALVQSRPEKSAGGRKSVLDFHLDAKREQHQVCMLAFKLWSALLLLVKGV